MITGRAFFHNNSLVLDGEDVADQNALLELSRPTAPRFQFLYGDA